MHFIHFEYFLFSNYCCMDTGEHVCSQIPEFRKVYFIEMFRQLVRDRNPATVYLRTSCSYDRLSVVLREFKMRTSICIRDNDKRTGSA